MKKVTTMQVRAGSTDEVRVEGLAVTAPGGVKLNEDVLRGIQDNRVPGGVDNLLEPAETNQ